MIGEILDALDNTYILVIQRDIVYWLYRNVDWADIPESLNVLTEWANKRGLCLNCGGSMIYTTTRNGDTVAYCPNCDIVVEG